MQETYGPILRWLYATRASGPFCKMTHALLCSWATSTSGKMMQWDTKGPSVSSRAGKSVQGVEGRLGGVKTVGGGGGT